MPTDTERLDFLEKLLKQVGQEDPHLCYDHEGIRGEQYFELQMTDRFITEDTIRDVIDRAISEAT